MSGQRSTVDFARSLIKGKIAELIFQHMFSEAGTCTVIPFGYEHLVPQLAQYQRAMVTPEELANIRNTPDFILISLDNKHVRLVDVKYRRQGEARQLKRIAEEVGRRWETAWIFLATLDGFYFSPCADIARDNGAIVPLNPAWIREELQDTYLNLLREFER